MPILSKEQFQEKIRTIVGDSTTDDTLEFIADMNDTYNNLESLASDHEDWRSKYEKLDNEWREKYKARFFDVPEKDSPKIDEDERKPLTYENLFKTERKK